MSHRSTLTRMAAIGLFATGLVSGAAQAATITYTLSGVVSNTTLAGLANGTPFSFEMSVDTESTPYASFPSLNLYYWSGSEASLILGSSIFEPNNTPQFLSSINPGLSELRWIMYGGLNPLLDGIDGATLTSAWVGFYSYAAVPPISSGIVPTGLTLADWGNAYVGFDVIDSYGTYIGFSSAITDVAVAVAAVPEPQTVALMLAGLGLIGWRLRRRG